METRGGPKRGLGEVLSGPTKIQGKKKDVRKGKKIKVKGLTLPAFNQRTSTNPGAGKRGGVLSKLLWSKIRKMEGHKQLSKRKPGRVVDNLGQVNLGGVFELKKIAEKGRVD